jgi:transcriptional regulator with GAF, ATPase, and Fis domain
MPAVNKAATAQPNAPDEMRPGESTGATSDRERQTLEAVERNHILNILRETNWVITGPRGAAGILGLHPSTLRSRIKKLGISRTAL